MERYAYKWLSSNDVANDNARWLAILAVSPQEVESIGSANCRKHLAID
jgi:hypothetical protein